MHKPSRLAVGDTVAIVSPSWGGPSIFPHIYEKGLEALMDLGLKIKEFPTARAEDRFLFENPQFRAEKLQGSFDIHSLPRGGTEAIWRAKL